MKILIINSEYPPVGGGAGNASANIARCLVTLGHDVSVLTAHFDDLPRKETFDKVEIYRIFAMRRRRDRSGALEQLAFILFASLAVFSLIRQSKPKAILAFFGVPSGAIAWLIRKIYQIPYIISLRGGDVPGFRPYDFKTFHKMIGPFLHVIWRNASFVIANSNGLHDLANAFDNTIEIPIIPNGVNVKQFGMDKHNWSPTVILSTGRVVYQKGLDLGLRALAQLKDLNWSWYIAGDGPQMDVLKALSHQLGISERVIFLGWQSRDELVKKYNQANLFLFPSRHEGMPNAVLEAMASGLPVVATKIAGSEELVLDGQTGFLVESENADLLRDALRRLIVDEKMRAKMGMASRLRVEQEYSWETVARQYSEYLTKIV